MPSALILVENDSVPADSRVWAECLSLHKAGWDVTAVSPKGQGRDLESFQELDGIGIHRFDGHHGSEGLLGYLREYSSAFLRISRLVRRLSREQSFDVVQACNPPDFLLLLTVGLRRRGAATIFDHHDLSPELYVAKYGEHRMLLRVLKAVERAGFSQADVVLSTNESFREIAIKRGGKTAEDVFVVRNGPATQVFRPMEADPELRGMSRHLIGYVGLMEDQDGVDVAIEALGELHRRRSDWHALLVGDGTALLPARQLAARLGIADAVSFLGYVQDRERLARIIASCDVCISPEPRNLLNERSTLVKVAEYMAVGRPVVAFDLRETRRTAGDAAAYAVGDDASALADAIDRLLEDPAKREEMGALGRERVETALSWDQSELALLRAYARAVEHASARRARKG